MHFLSISLYCCKKFQLHNIYSIGEIPNQRLAEHFTVAIFGPVVMYNIYILSICVLEKLETKSDQFTLLRISSFHDLLRF